MWVIDTATAEFLMDSWEKLEHGYLLSIPAFMQDVVVVYPDNGNMCIVNLGLLIGGRIDVGTYTFFEIHTTIFPDENQSMLIRLAPHLCSARSLNGTR